MCVYWTISCHLEVFNAAHTEYRRGGSVAERVTLDRVVAGSSSGRNLLLPLLLILMVMGSVLIKMTRWSSPTHVYKVNVM